MSDPGSLLLVVSIAAAAAAADPPPDCLPSTQRPSTCQLEFSWWREAIAWGVVAANGGGTLVARHYEDNSARWQTAGDWERWLRHELRYTDASSRSTTRRRADTTAYLLPAAGVVAASIATSMPAMVDGQVPTEGLEDIYTVATAFMLGSQLNQLLKVTVARRRPGVRTVDGKARSPAAVHSFPSGHTIAVFGMSSAYATTLYLRRAELWWLAAAAGGLLGTYTGMARIITDDHWGGDVVVGAMLGVGVGIVYPLLAHARLGANEDEAAVVTLLPIAGGLALDVRF